MCGLKGGAGAKELAQAVLASCDQATAPKRLYAASMIVLKIR